MPIWFYNLNFLGSFQTFAFSDELMINMADVNVCDKVLRWVCNHPAVRKIIYCGDCKVWSHISCSEKKKCGEVGNSSQTSDTEDTNSVKCLTSTINSLSDTVRDMKKIVNDVVQENRILRQKIEQLKTEKIQFRASSVIVSNFPNLWKLQRIARF